MTELAYLPLRGYPALWLGLPAGLVAGSKRALVVTLNDGLKPPLLTGIPHPIAENIRQIEAVGTKTLWIKADPPNVNLLDPKEIAPALRTGYDRAKQEIDTIRAFWG